MSSLVPEGWELSPLSSLADYKNGRAFKPSDWSKSGLPILRIAQINNPHKVEDYYDGNDIDDGHFITKGDLIFSWSATLKAEIWSHYDAVLNQHIFKVTEKVGTNRSYLQQLLDYAIPKLAESSHGSTMKHIKKGVLDEFFSPVPPLPEQKKIASILTSVDEVIENTQKQIDKLQDLKKATMSELLTKGIGHTEFKDSELGRIPASWEVCRLGDILAEKPSYGANASAINKDFATVRYIRITDINDYGQLRSDSTAFIKDSDAEGYFLTNDDLLIARTGNTVGKTYLHESNKCDSSTRFAYAGYLILFRFNKDRARPKYIFQYTLSKFFKYWIKENSRVGAQPNINAQEYSSFVLPLPSLKEQDSIVSILLSIDWQKQSLNKKLTQTQSLKKSLMQDLLTGKVRVAVN